jgi:hypothetical protein
MTEDSCQHCGGHEYPLLQSFLSMHDTCIIHHHLGQLAFIQNKHVFSLQMYIWSLVNIKILIWICLCILFCVKNVALNYSNTLSWVFIMQDHYCNSPRVSMSLNSDSESTSIWSYSLEICAIRRSNHTKVGVKHKSVNQSTNQSINCVHTS